MNDVWKKSNKVMREIIEDNIPKHKRTSERRPRVTRESKKEKGQEQSLKEFSGRPLVEKETKMDWIVRAKRDLRI